MDERTAERKQQRQRVRESKRDERGGKDNETHQDKGGARKGNIPHRLWLIFRQTDKKKIQPDNSTSQSDADSPDAADFGMLRRSSILNHLKLGKFKTRLYSLRIYCDT